MKAATIKLNDKTGKYEAIYNGQILVKSASRQYAEFVITSGTNQKAKRLGVTHVSNPENLHVGIVPSEMPEEISNVEEFSITERFEFVEEVAQMIVDRNIPSAILCGEGGLGKSYTITKVLKANGLLDIQEQEQPKAPEEPAKDADDVEWEIFNSFKPAVVGDYIIVKGFSTAKGLYRTLYENSDKIVIFDDCDSIQKNEVAVNILKSALDSYDRRLVTWNSESPYSDLPKCFLFTGQVIFISNWSLDKIAQPLRSRSISIDLSMTNDQKLERMQTIITSGEFQPDICTEYKQEAYDLIVELKARLVELNLRTLISVCKIRNGNKPNWKKLATYTLVETA